MVSVLVGSVFPRKAKLVLAAPTLAAHSRHANSRFPAPPGSAGCLQRSERQSLLLLRPSSVAPMTPPRVEFTGLPQKPTRHLSGGNKTGCHLSQTIKCLCCGQSAPRIYRAGTVAFRRQSLATRRRSHTLTIGLLCRCLRTKREHHRRRKRAENPSIDFPRWFGLHRDSCENLYPEKHEHKHAAAAR